MLGLIGDAQMDAEGLLRGLTSLNSLAQTEYHQSLADIIVEDDRPVAALRIGRLVGVLLKEPFSEPLARHHPSSSQVRAYREWHLRGDDRLINSRSGTWQYRALSEIIREFSLTRDVPDLCRDAAQEHGFFGYFAWVLRKYICGDKQTRKLVDNALKAGTKAGHKLPPVTPEAIVAAGGVALGALLVERIPIMGMVGVPVIAAVVVILYTLGVSAFCQWIANLRTGAEKDLDG
ncbi:MAG TPA: hypothetical protein VK797_20855 [Tepidisphaeraceae bacterium]|nr:hypothetical protein [Tepidisphaeraceae bacterium]